MREKTSSGAVSPPPLAIPFQGYYALFGPLIIPREAQCSFFLMGTITNSEMNYSWKSTTVTCPRGRGGVREYNTEKEDLKMGAHGWR